MSCFSAGHRGLVQIGLALAMAGCQDPTQVTVDLRTDVPCVASGEDPGFGSAAIYAIDAAEVANDAGVSAPNALTQQCAPGVPVSEIGTLAVIPGEAGDDGSFGLRIHVGVGEQTGESCARATCGDDQCIDIRRRVSFVPHRSLRLPITASRNCLGVCCPDAEETCVNGSCVPVDSEGCDPETESCDPETPDPPESTASLTVLHSDSFDLNDATVDLTAGALLTTNGGGIYAIGGTYQTDGAKVLEIGGLPLPPSPSEASAFWATFELTPTPRITSLTFCQGAVPTVRDVALTDTEVRALLYTTATAPLSCGRVGGGITAAGNVRSGFPMVVELEPGAPATPPIITSVLSPQSLQGAEAFSLTASASATSVSGVFLAGGATPRFSNSVSVSPNDGPGLWTWSNQIMGNSVNTTFDDAPDPLGYFLTRDDATGARWRIGLANVGMAKELTAVPAEMGFMPRTVSGDIVDIGRPRRLTGSLDVVIPIEIDGEVDLGPDAPGVVAARIEHPMTPGSGLQAVLVHPGGTNPLAAGTAARLCLAYVLGGETRLDCEGLDELNLTGGVDLDAFDVAPVTTANQKVDAALLVGIHRGSVPALDVMATNMDDRILVALLGLPD